MMLLAAVVVTFTVVGPAPADGWSQYVHPPIDDIGMVIAECESENRNVLTQLDSTASGYWQFLDSTWEWVTGLEPPAMAYPRFRQREAFEALWNDGRGASHWAPSRHCWGGAHDERNRG